MDINGFKAWAEARFGKSTRTAGSAVSRCKRIARAFGNLDAAYDRDGLQSLRIALTYTTEDEHNGVRPPAGLFEQAYDEARFKTIHEGMNSLRRALDLYTEYRCSANVRAAA